MEPNELKSLWQAYDQKIEKSLQLNQHILQELQSQKAKSKLNRLAIWKIAMIILGILWVLFLGFLVANSLTYSKIFFVVSGLGIMAVTTYAIVVYIQHVALITQIDNSSTVVEAQQKIAQLKASTLQVTRILFLQAPFYCTWFLTPQWLMNDPLAWLIPVPIALAFTGLAVWLYRNISYKNQDKKWFKLLFNSPEWNNVVQAEAFLSELEAFKNN
ncbi:MAG: hypothetical protein U0Y10_11385 [Spirosomataceae bacterium]